MLTNANSLVKGDWSRLCHHRRQGQYWLSRLKKAYEAQNWHLFCVIRDSYFRSFSVKLCAVLEIAARDKVALTFGEAMAIAAEISPFRDCGEPVTTYQKKKSSGGRRQIVKFEIRRRALQLMVKNYAEWTYGYKTENFIAPGKGRRALVREALKRINRDGYSWFVVFDIKDCFGSLGHKGIAQKLKIPIDIVRTVLAEPNPLNKGTDKDNSPHIHTTTSSHRETPDPVLSPPGGRLHATKAKGIAQGSMASSIVAAAMLHELLKSLPKGVDAPVFVYGDDVLVLVRNKADALTIRRRLESGARYHPAGPLTFKTCLVRSADRGFCFLGYRWRQASEMFGGKMYVHPTWAAFESCKRKRLRICLKAAQACLNALFGTDPLPEKLPVEAKEALSKAGRVYDKQWIGSNSEWIKSAHQQLSFEATCERQETFAMDTLKAIYANALATSPDSQLSFSKQGL